MQDRFTGVSFHCKALYTDLGEGDLAEPLAKVAAANLKVHTRMHKAHEVLFLGLNSGFIYSISL